MNTRAHSSIREKTALQGRSDDRDKVSQDTVSIVPPILHEMVPSHSLSEREAPVRTDSTSAALPLQAKLRISQPGDVYEQEADHVAQQVVQRLNAPSVGLSRKEDSVQRETLLEEEDLQMKPLADQIQREEMPDEDELQMKPMQMRGNAIGGGEASTDLESAINGARGGGHALDDDLQRTMGQAMGVDFSGVRVHTDAEADQLNQSIHAKAFTTGQDVFFRSGAYEPGSQDGQELIAHELTHVVQQGSASKKAQKKSMPQEESQINSFSPFKSQARCLIQRTEREDDDWDQKAAAKFMMEKQVKEDGTADLDKQNKANASIWHNTMFSNNLPETDKDVEQEKMLKKQQAMLKRHFLAQAVFGVQGGTQFKPERKKIFGKNTPAQEEDYKPIEEYKKDGVSANLATLASGGGRFNYRSKDNSGEAFNKFLLTGNSNESNSKELGEKERRSTHSESLHKDGEETKIREEDVKLGKGGAMGINIPIGGVGTKTKDHKQREVTIGYQGRSEVERRNPTLKRFNKKEFQTGHMLHQHATEGNNSQTMIAFEGSAPNTDNIHGGSHGALETIKKKAFGKKSEKTLTGQSKRSELGLPSGLGGIKADVTEDKLEELKEYEEALEKLRKSENPDVKSQEEEFYKNLLKSTTADEQIALLEGLSLKREEGD